MATYNGARYIGEQLASLAAQDVLPCELVVCDDGSTDGTPEIVEEFALVAPFPVRLFRNEKTLGFAENFLQAARLCCGEWVAFSDQDDVWLPNKVRMAAQAIELNKSLVLVLQNAFICNESLQHSGRKFPNSTAEGIYGKRSQYGFSVWLGFLQTFRAELFQLSNILPLPANYYAGHPMLSHDKWTCLIANALGGMCVLEEPVALCRRHEKTVTGDYAKQSAAERLSRSYAVGADEYFRQASVATESAKYLSGLSAASNSCVSRLLISAAGSFQTISSILAIRADLYSASSIPRRLWCFMRIAIKGGYVGPGIIALGWKGGAKDLTHSLGMFGLLRKLVK